MLELSLTGWIYFRACGFELEIDEFRGGYAIMAPAPNIAGFWIRKDMIVGVVDWKKSRGIDCTSVYIFAAEKPLHVIGTTKEILEKLRD